MWLFTFTSIVVGNFLKVPQLENHPGKKQRKLNHLNSAWQTKRGTESNGEWTQKICLVKTSGYGKVTVDKTPMTSVVFFDFIV